MRIDLRPARARVVFAGAVLLVAGSYAAVAARQFLAWRAADRLDEAGLRRSVELMPGHAEFHNRLGRYFLNVAFDVDRGIHHFQAATLLNPHSARYWLDLADAHLVGDDLAAQESAVERALSVEPTNPEVALRAANHYLVSGDTDRALARFRVVIENHTPEVASAVIETCWRATGDAQLVMDRALPPTAQAYSTLLNLLVDRGQTQAAEQVWKRLIDLRQEIPFRPVLWFLEHLIREGKIEAASGAWEEWTQSRPELQAYQHGQERVVNGGFELPALNGGFDWRYSPAKGISLAVDSSQFRGGVQALRIDFDDAQEFEAGLMQVVPVKPGTRYEFTAFRKGDTILTHSGPRLALTDHYTGEVQLLTEDILGTTAWRQDRTEFVTGSNTYLLRLRVMRTSTARPVRGRLWVDDISLVEKEP